jgi:hypothetical protein
VKLSAAGTNSTVTAAIALGNDAHFIRLGMSKHETTGALQRLGMGTNCIVATAIALVDRGDFIRLDIAK